MKNVHSDVGSVEQVGDGDALGIVDLGDAVTETKEWFWIPFVEDNLLLLGYDYG